MVILVVREFFLIQSCSECFYGTTSKLTDDCLDELLAFCFFSCWLAIWWHMNNFNMQWKRNHENSSFHFHFFYRRHFFYCFFTNFLWSLFLQLQFLHAQFLQSQFVQVSTIVRRLYNEWKLENLFEFVRHKDNLDIDKFLDQCLLWRIKKRNEKSESRFL